MSTSDEPTRGPTFTDALRARRESIVAPAGLMLAVRDAADRSAPSPPGCDHCFHSGAITRVLRRVAFQAAVRACIRG